MDKFYVVLAAGCVYAAFLHDDIWKWVWILLGIGMVVNAFQKKIDKIYYYILLSTLTISIILIIVFDFYY